MQKPTSARISEILGHLGDTQPEIVAALKRATGREITVQAVQNWVKRGVVPARWVFPISNATDGAIAPEEIRPDIFGLLKDKTP